MKDVFRCQWECIPGDGQHEQNYPTLAAAKLAMRQIIAQKIDLRAYIADLDAPAGAFLQRYFSDPHFPAAASDVPGEYEEPEDGELFLDPGFIVWKHPYNAYPKLETTLVLEEPSDASFRFDFYYEYPMDATGSGVTELFIKINARKEYGTSAYPLMVLHALREYPQTQTQLSQMIFECWDTRIDRKAIGRHLQLLKNLGFSLGHCKEGYYLSGSTAAPNTQISYTPNAYPLLILQALDGTPKTQAAIIGQVEATYGVKIDRKAVSRHIGLLREFGTEIQKCPNGYCICSEKTS